MIRLLKRNKNDLDKLKNFYNSLKEEKATFSAPWDLIRTAKLTIINEYEGKIIAMRGISNKYESFICVKKEFQGHGIGKKLYELSLIYFRKIGIKKVRASSFNPISQHLLEKSGFKRLYRVDKTVYYELSLSKILKITFPLRCIIYLFYGFWMNLKQR